MRLRRTTLVGLPVAALALAALTACGTGSSSGAPSGSAPGGADMAAYTSCLAENGVTLPTPGDGGAAPPSESGGTPPTGQPPTGGPGGAGGQAPEGVDQATWEAAQQACADLAPAPPSGEG